MNAAEQKVIDMGSLSRNSLFIYLAVLGLCCCKGSFLVVVRGAPLCCSVRTSHCSGSSYGRVQTLGQACFRSCASRAPGHRLNSCGTRV